MFEAFYVTTLSATKILHVTSDEWIRVEQWWSDTERGKSKH